MGERPRREVLEILPPGVRVSRTDSTTPREKIQGGKKSFRLSPRLRRENRVSGLSLRLRRVKRVFRPLPASDGRMPNYTGIIHFGCPRREKGDKPHKLYLFRLCYKSVTKSYSDF